MKRRKHSGLQFEAELIQTVIWTSEPNILGNHFCFLKTQTIRSIMLSSDPPDIEVKIMLHFCFIEYIQLKESLQCDLFYQ